MLEAEQAGQKISLSEQGSPGAQEEKGTARCLTTRSGFAGRRQSCGSYMQGVGTEGQIQLQLNLVSVL